jgi:hypothetical protein
VARPDRARAAASHLPGSAGANPDDLAARRKAVAERLFAKQCAETLARLREQEAVDHVAADIARSIRAHPSNPKPFDWEAEW